MMEYKRNCPTCFSEILYINRVSFLRASRNKINCKICVDKARVGLVVSEETKKLMRDNAYDRNGSNNPNYGKVSVLKGKKIEDFLSVESVKIHKERLSVGMFKNRKHTQESKNKTSLKTSGEKNGFYGKKHTEELKNENRARTLIQLKNKEETNIELKFEEYLKELNIDYRKQETFAFWSFDFYLPKYDVYLECDGDYWHFNPNIFKDKEPTFSQKKNLGNDKRKNGFMKSNNKQLLRFWETDILNNKENILNSLKKFI